MSRFTFNMARAKDVALIIDDKKFSVVLTNITTASDYTSGVEFEGFIKPEPWSYTDRMKHPTIKNVIFNPPATIVFWTDGTKTVVKCQDGDEFDPEKGIAMAYIKKANGDKGNYNEIFKPWVEKYYEEREKTEKCKETIRRSVYRNFANSIFGAYGQFKPKCVPYVGDYEVRKEVEALQKRFEFLNKMIADPSYYPLLIQPSCYDDDKYERALKYFETNMGEGPCDIPYCEDCGAQLVAIEAIRRCLEKDKKEKENA
jgi:hypothetical protein